MSTPVIENDLKCINERILKLDERICNVEDTILAKEIETLSTSENKTTIGNSNGDSNGDSNEFDKRISNLEDIIMVKEYETISVENTNAKLTNDITTLIKRVDNLENDKINLENEVSKLGKRCNEFEDINNKLSTELEHIKKSIKLNKNDELSKKPINDNLYITDNSSVTVQISNEFNINLLDNYDYRQRKTYILSYNLSKTYCDLKLGKYYNIINYICWFCYSPEIIKQIFEIYGELNLPIDTVNNINSTYEGISIELSPLEIILRRKNFIDESFDLLKFISNIYISRNILEFHFIKILETLCFRSNIEEIKYMFDEYKKQLYDIRKLDKDISHIFKKFIEKSSSDILAKIFTLYSQKDLISKCIDPITNNLEYSNYCTPELFMEIVDICHENNLKLSNEFI